MIKVSIGKTGKVIDVDFDAMPENAKAFIIAYGLKQKLNDAGASITEDVEPDEGKRADLKLGAAENVLEALMAGDITTRQSAAGMTLEEQCVQKWLRAKYKEIFKEKISELVDSSNGFLVGKIAQKLGITSEALEEKLEPLGKKLAEKERAIRALKNSDVPDIEV